MGLLINVIGYGLIQGCDVGVLQPVVFSLSRHNVFGKRISFFVFSYGYMFSTS